MEDLREKINLKRAINYNSWKRFSILLSKIETRDTKFTYFLKIKRWQ